MNIYVGNLDYNLQESELEEVFAEFGQVDSVKIIKDRFTDRSKGYGFVEMADEGEAQNAIEQLDGKLVNGRNLRVNKARPPKKDF